jgi:hypothetical protein
MIQADTVFLRCEVHHEQIVDVEEHTRAE